MENKDQKKNEDEILEKNGKNEKTEAEEQLNQIDDMLASGEKEISKKEEHEKHKLFEKKLDDIDIDTKDKRLRNTDG